MPTITGGFTTKDKTVAELSSQLASAGAEIKTPFRADESLKYTGSNPLSSFSSEKIKNFEGEQQVVEEDV